MSSHFLYPFAGAKVPQVDGEILACVEFQYFSGFKGDPAYLRWRDTCRQG